MITINLKITDQVHAKGPKNMTILLLLAIALLTALAANTASLTLDSLPYFPWEKHQNNNNNNNNDNTEYENDDNNNDSDADNLSLNSSGSTVKMWFRNFIQEMSNNNTGINKTINNNNNNIIDIMSYSQVTDFDDALTRMFEKEEYNSRLVHYLTCLAVVNVSEYVRVMYAYNVQDASYKVLLANKLMKTFHLPHSLHTNDVDGSIYNTDTVIINNSASQGVLLRNSYCEDILFPPACPHLKSCVESYKNFTMIEKRAPFTKGRTTPVLYFHISKCAGTHFHILARKFEYRAMQFACTETNKNMIYNDVLKMNCKGNYFHYIDSLFNRMKISLSGLESGFRDAITAPEPIIFGLKFFLVTRLREPLSLMKSARKYFTPALVNGTEFFVNTWIGRGYNNIFVRVFSGEKYQELTKKHLEIAKLHISHYNLVLLHNCTNFLEIMKDKLLWRHPNSVTLSKNKKITMEEIYELSNSQFRVSNSSIVITNEELDFMKSRIEWDNKFYSYVIDSKLSPCISS